MGKQARIVQFGSVFLINLSVKGFIDIILNPILMIEFGYLLSILSTTLIYATIGIISVKLYDLYKIDCLMIESLKESQYNHDQISNKNRLVNLITKWAKRSRPLLGLLLSLKNTGLMVIYRRDGFHLYNGFAGKNIKLVFLINSLLVSIIWNTVVYTGFSIWEFIKGIF